MSVFQNPTDIANRALQHCGAARIAAGALLTEDSKNASEIRACYDKLRVAELRRAVWRFAIRNAALRAIGNFNAAKFVTFPAWASGTTYGVNDVTLGSGGEVYYSLAANNSAHDPISTAGYWSNYFGPVAASEYVTAWGAGFIYAKGDHAIGSDSTVYVSQTGANANNNPVGDNGAHWEAASAADSGDTTAPTDTSFYAGELAFVGGTVYLSLQSGNADAPPSPKWLTLTAQPALALPNFIYPIDAGPCADLTSRNVFRLPNGYLRTAPQYPKAGRYSILGAPTAMMAEDWELEGDYLISGDAGVIVFRFAADFADVTKMDPLFCEYLAARIGLEVCEPLTQSTAKIQILSRIYAELQTEAITVNGIETGAIEPPLDDYLATRT